MAATTPTKRDLAYLRRLYPLQWGPLRLQRRNGLWELRDGEEGIHWPLCKFNGAQDVLRECVDMTFWSGGEDLIPHLLQALLCITVPNHERRVCSCSEIPLLFGGEACAGWYWKVAAPFHQQ